MPEVFFLLFRFEIWKNIVGRGCEHVLQVSDFFVFGTGDTNFYLRNMTKTPPKNQQIPL